LGGKPTGSKVDGNAVKGWKSDVSSERLVVPVGKEFGDFELGIDT